MDYVTNVSAYARVHFYAISTAGILTITHQFFLTLFNIAFSNIILWLVITKD